MSLTNKTAVVTGASKGLGRAIAKRLAQEGCNLALVARSAEALSQLADELATPLTTGSGIKAQGFACDLSCTESLFKCVDQIKGTFGSVDILINNAGTGFYKPFIDHSPAEHDAIIDVNIKAAIHLTYALLPQMLEKQQGQIINIASDLSTRPLANMAVYAASKFALRGFSLSLLKEVKNQGIKVSLLNPGIIDTCFNNNTPGNQPAQQALQPDALAETVLQLLTQPQFQLIDELTVHPQLQDF
ncbi:MAG: SDR family NAD(P)-dependent oxidoreductase [Algicola sp.]|nr:SDR family NAD(P)-dependent oxidoreductase [Algicola sp.]